MKVKDILAALEGADPNKTVLILGESEHGVLADRRLISTNPAGRVISFEDICEEFKQAGGIIPRHLENNIFITRSL